MKELDLVKKKNDFSKGASRYSVTCLIEQKDVDGENIPQSWVGMEITKNVYQWAEITKEKANLEGGNIRSRVQQAEQDKAKNVPARSTRSMVGLDEYVHRVNQRSNRNKKNKQKAINCEAVANSWLQGRI